MYNNNYYKRERSWDTESESDGESYFTTYSPKRTKLTPTITEHHLFYRPSRTRRKFTINIDNYNRTSIITTLTSHPGRARDWLYQTLHTYRRLIIGLGVQWVPPNHPAATLQLCIGRRVLIFSLSHARSCPRILRRVLSNPTNTFVGLWSNDTDRKKLEGCAHGLEVLHGMPIDMRRHLGVRELERARIQEIAERRVGIDVGYDHGVAMSRWDDYVVDFGLDQVREASLDAYVAFLIGMQEQAWRLNPRL